MRRSFVFLFVLAASTPAHAGFVNFESQHVHPLAMTPDGTRLLAVNTPDGHLAVFTITPTGLERTLDIPVGIDPVSVAAESDTRAWVVNHLSDTVSLVDLVRGYVVETLAVGDEPTDVVFAGAPRRAFVCVSQEDAIKIFDPANLASPPVVVPVFASDPQALATNAGGTRVFAAVAESGNQTTIAGMADVEAHGGLPAPNPPGRPDAALILRRVNGVWQDEIGRSFNDTHPYTLPDHDVVVLDANQAVPVPAYLDGLGTTHFNLGVHPVTGKVYTTNTEALNHIRFEPNLRGRFLRTRVSIVDPLMPAGASFVDLNPHINYAVTPGPQGEIDLSLSQPGGMAFAPGGGAIYVAALGSAKVAVLADDGTVLARIAVGNGPSGVALDAARDRLYVLERFDHTISIVDTGSRVVEGTVSLGFDPQPVAVRDGRRFLYDGRISSGHGDVACASCHVGANFDNIAWDLGDPNGSFQAPPPDQIDPFLLGFHPMKGPMATQTLRGLAGTEPFHWRGDRSDFIAFNGAFVSLMGRASQLSTADMQAFEDFILSIRFGPNPNQNLDRSFPNPPTGPSPERGRLAFTTVPLDGPFRCVDCHSLPTGTNGQLVNRFALQESQDMKIPQLRNMYEKTGFDYAPGEKKRGFGFIHDGSLPTLFDFLRLPVFDFGSGGDAMRRDIEAFLLAFDTGTAPAVGAQITVSAANRNHPAVINWIDRLIAQDETSNCDLVVKGRQNGLVRGWVYDGAGRFRSDRAADALVDKTVLRSLADVGSELTYTGVPAGSGMRLGVDHDEDGYFDRTEVDAGSDPADPGSTPLTVDTQPDVVAGTLLFEAVAPNPMCDAGSVLSLVTAQRTTGRVGIYDVAGRRIATVHDGMLGPGRVRLHWDGTDARGRRVAAGNYYVRIESPAGVRTRPLTILR